MKKRMKKLSVLLAAATALGAMSVCTTAFAETETETASAAGEKPGAGKTLKVAMECGYAPYNWTQPDDPTEQCLFLVDLIMHMDTTL